MIGVEPSRRRTIFSLSLPIIGGMMSQNILNLVDTAMVGTLGDEAIAAVGIGGFANFLAQAFILGLGTGVQAMAARRLGEGRTDATALPLNGGLLLVLLMALPLSAVLYVAAPLVLPLLNSNLEVQALGTSYLQARLVGMAAVGMNFCFRGYWNGVSLSRLYLRTLVVMHVSNVIISYGLIFGALGLPALGSTGAGVGTTIATYLGTIYYVALGLTHARQAGFLRRLADRATIRTILRLSIPNGFQQVTFSGGFTLLFWIIGRMGDGEMAAANVAAANVLINVTLLAVLPGMGLGLAANSLVGQALGRNDPRDAQRWAWDVVRVGVVLLGTIGIPMVLVPDAMLGLFLHDPQTSSIARLPLQIVGASIAADGVGLVLLQSLLGAGASRTVLFVSTGMQWGVFLPAAYLVGPLMGFGLTGIWLANVLYRVSQAGVLSFIWQRGRWARIEL